MGRYILVIIVILFILLSPQFFYIFIFRHTHYTEDGEGSKRTRVRFNIQGQYGSAFVFAEVSNKMSPGDFVYVLVQDKRNGNVITVVDNRSAIVAYKMAGDSKEGQEAFRTLLGE